MVRKQCIKPRPHARTTAARAAKGPRQPPPQQQQRLKKLIVPRGFLDGTSRFRLENFMVFSL